MKLPYDEYRFLFPPRPEQKIPPAMIGFYQRRGWSCQVKKNGTCNVIAVTPQKKIICRQRDGTDHRAWAADPQHMKPFIQLPGKGFYVFSAELLHNKTPKIKNVNYIFDIMVNNGEYLVGSTFAERQQMLHDLFMFDGEQFFDVASHWHIDQHVWLAKTFTPEQKNFKEFYEEVIPHDEDEGLVFKDPNGRLDLCTKEKSNGGWMVKCRRPHKNYSF